MADFSDILLTVDFDRTLTAPDSSIPPRNLEAIAYFMEHGGAFTVNTGRSIPMYAGQMNVIPVNAPLLLYNGSAAYDLEKREFTFLHEIDLDWRSTIREMMELCPDLTVEFQGVDAHWIFREDQAWKAFSEANRCPCGIASFEDDLGPFLKFSVYGTITDTTVAHLFDGTPEEFARMDAVERMVQERFGDKCTAFRAANRILDIHAKGVSKGRSARELQEKLGRKILVCVGDAENDLSMLEAADYAYCPVDAIIRDRFENVCGCADGAVADVIYRKIKKL